MTDVLYTRPAVCIAVRWTTHTAGW